MLRNPADAVGDDSGRMQGGGKSDAKVSDMKFTVISETELPDELKKIIEEKKQKGDETYIYVR